MVNTRGSNSIAVPERSILQLHRDHVACNMDFTWPPLPSARPSALSRGIENGTNAACYQNSVHQALVHQPCFLRWIVTHDTPAFPCDEDVNTCIRCCLKLLVETYWDATNPNVHLRFANNAPGHINRLTCQTWRFNHGRQEDAFLYLMWIIDELPATPVLSRDWQAQFDTLFRLDIQAHDTCQACRNLHKPRSEPQYSLDIPINTDDTDITQPIDEIMIQAPQGVYCTHCRSNQTKDRRNMIVAAPKILCIKFNLTNPNGTKILHTLSYPEILDLRQYQETNGLPLNYRLMSVVSHSGRTTNSGHYIASVRERVPGTFMCISDLNTANFSLAELLANPQIWSDSGFEAAMLIYERDDAVRAMPLRMGRDGGKKRLRRELRGLTSELRW